MRRKEVFTTGEVAKICCVAPRTVSKWFDSGRLRGYRIPGSRDRRIPVTQLVRFMSEHGIPFRELDGNVIRVLVASSETSGITAVAGGLAQMNRYELETAANDFEAGMRAGNFRPHVILVDLLAEALDAGEILRNLRANPSLSAAVVAVGGPLTNGQKRALLREGFDAVLAWPFKLEYLVESIESAADLVT